MNSSKAPLLFEIQVVINESNTPKLSLTSFMPVDDDISHDLTTFKQYLSDYIGISGNVPLKYVDDDKDQIPIDCEDEFKEAMEFARQRSSKGEVLMLIIDISKIGMFENIRTKMIEATKCKMAPKKKYGGKTKDTGTIVYNATGVRDSPPDWFIAYMDKFKAEILADVKVMISKKSEPKEPKSKRRPKRHSEDESSDNQQSGSEPRNCKILRKLEKLQKREKKLEQKLDQRMEKMEFKKKRMLEKVSQTKNGKRKSNEVPNAPCLMGGISVKPLSPIHVRPYQMFSRTWTLMNEGTIPWTDATELRQAWVSAGLEAENTVVKCPTLAPGQQAPITVLFTAPGTPGTYHSYWHLFHMGERFGHWMVCSVIVDVPTIEEASSSTDAKGQDKDLAVQMADMSLREDDTGSELELCSNESESDSIDSFVVVDEPESESKGITFKEVSDNLKMMKMAGKIKKRSNVILEKLSNKNKYSCNTPDDPLTQEKHLVDDSNVPNLINLTNNVSDASCTQSAGHPPNVNPMCDFPPLVFMPTVLDAPPVYSQTMSPLCDPPTLPPGLDIPSNCYYFPPYMSYSVPTDANVNNLRMHPDFIRLSAMCTSSTVQSLKPVADQVQNLVSMAAAVELSNATTGDEIAENTVPAVAISTSPVVEASSPSNGNQAENLPESAPNVTHNIPETLITGAMNVASKALNTAQTVFSNLHLRSPAKQGDASDYDPLFESNMVMLCEMGFLNIEKNAEVLKSVGNNIENALPILLNLASQNNQQ